VTEDEPLQPGVCGHSLGVLGSGFPCVETGPHNKHVWRGDGQASRGLGHADSLPIGIEVHWCDDRPAATVGDMRRLIAASRPGVVP
jgi:hypothetical protein